jgi:hypothetical protein
MFHVSNVSERAGLCVRRLGDKISADSGAVGCEPGSSAATRQAFKTMASGHVVLAAIALLLAGCGRRTPALEHTEAAALLSTTKAGITDGRGRFREIYCAVRRDHGAALPYDRPCEDTAALWRLQGEPPPTGRPVVIGHVAPGTRVVMVPGLLAECVADLSKVFADATANLEAQGYATGYIQTRGRQGSDANADIIRDAIMALPARETLILVTHSKGTVDTLEALAKYPALANRVAAVISVSGAVYGSPLADRVPGALVYLGHQMPLATCPPGENVEAVESLRRSVRLAWFATHRLPARVRFYSLAAFAQLPDVSALLTPFWSSLAQTDPANDGLVVASDVIVPGSTLLGYPNADHLAPNADHLAVAMPFPAGPLINCNDYPRAAAGSRGPRRAEDLLTDADTIEPRNSEPLSQTGWR